jgi:hypothetical protein
VYIIIYNKVHRQLRWFTDSVNFVFTFLYAVFYNCYHTFGFLKARNFLTVEQP